MVRRIGLGFLSVLVGVAVVTGPTYAQSAAVTEVRCTVSEARIKTRLTTIQTLRETRTKVYQGILDRTDALVTSAKAKGYDTKDLESARSATQTAFDTYTTNATNYETALTSTQGYACGENAEQFMNALVTSRTGLATLRASSVSLRTTITTDLVPSIKAYAAWLKTQVTTSTDTEGN